MNSFSFLIGESPDDSEVTRALPPDVRFEDCDFRQPEWCPGVIIGVRDGDTPIALICTNVLLKSWIQRAIRVYKYDAPETRTKNVAEKQHGLEAKAFFEETTFMKQVVLHLDGKQTFDRLLGHGWFLDGVSFAEMMADAGFTKLENY